GLLHDVGLKEIPREIIENPRAQLTMEERRIFESHSHRGMEILNKVPGLSEDVILSAYQHHEANTGEGYPQHLHRLKIHPVAKLITTANTFCEFTIARPGQSTLSADIALKHMKIRESTLEADFFSALKRVFKFNERPKK
ncbi:MAG: HD-GYP domain-containing protein, partial [Pseudobdellovibrionaceae bacterium]